MSAGTRLGSSSRNKWPITLSRVIGAIIGGACAIFVVRPLVGQLPFWLGLVAFCASIGVGAALGQLIGHALFRPVASVSPEDGEKNP